MKMPFYEWIIFQAKGNARGEFFLEINNSRGVGFIALTLLFPKNITTICCCFRALEP